MAESEWLSLPANSTELAKLKMKGKSHPAMKMAYKSIRIHRAPNRAFILLLGETGSGKSSTINHLFNTDVAPINKSESQKHSTTEYVVTMKSEEWQIPDLTMSIIDTPGFFDTGGFDEDVRNLASIKTFCNQHPYLGKKKYPNLVFLVQKITDNRMEGSNSRFSNLLRALSHINVIDKNNQNVVVILTHAAMLPRKTEKWVAIVNDQMKIISSAVETHVGIKPKIVVQENLPDDYGLEEDGDWHILPNGERQPRKLFLACQSLLNISEDELCHEALSVYFRPGKKTTPEIGFVVSPDNVKSSLIKEIQGALLGPIIPTEDTEVVKLLKAYKVNTNIAEVDKEIHKLILRLSCLKINDICELQSLSMNKLKVRFDNIPITSTMEKILKDVFGMEYKNVSSIDCLVGKGFNIFSDQHTIKTPIKLNGSSTGKLGLPSNLTVHKCNILEVYCKAVRDYNHYVTERLGDLKLELSGRFNVSMFGMQVRSGYNKEGKTGTLQSVNSLTFSIEQRSYKVTIEDKDIEIVEEFEKDVNRLPETYDELNDDNVKLWNMFFEKWGQFVTIGVYLGGSVTGTIEGQVKKSNSSTENCQNILTKLATRLAFLQGDASSDCKSSSLIDLTETGSMKEMSVKWDGGTYIPKATSFENVDNVEWEKWQETVEFSPTSLTTSIDLYPVYLIAERVCKEKSLEMKKAFESDLYLKKKCSTVNYNRMIRRALGLDFDKIFNSRNAVARSNPNDGCFHESATVLLSDMTRKEMKDVSVGDRVITLNTKLEAVHDTIITWIHKVPKGLYEFVQIVHDFGTLYVTKEHIVYIEKSCTPVFASEVSRGDTMEVLIEQNGKLLQCVTTVHSVQDVQMKGLYAPLTQSGNLVVDGVAVSCYCKMKCVRMFGKQILTSQSLAHLGFLPLRIAYKIGINVHEKMLDTSTGLHTYAKWLMKKTKRIF